VKNHNGDYTYIRKLFNLAYRFDVPKTKVPYSERLADDINNGLFKRRPIKKYMETNKLNKPTLVQKSEDKDILVLKDEETQIKAILINEVPSQYQYLYIDKTK
jgi:hypothetical protein